MKTKYIIFSRPGLQAPPILLEIENNDIDRVEKSNFLGLEINENLDWSSHTDKLSLKLYKNIGVLKRLRAHLPVQTLRTIYFSLFQSHLDFQILAWCYNSDSIFRLQEKAMRVISSSHSLAYTDPIFINLGILKLPDLHSSYQLIFLQKYLQRLLSSYFMEFIFPLVQHHHSYPTRNCYKFGDLPLLLNSMSPEIIEKLYTHSEPTFSKFAKKCMLSFYSPVCEVEGAIGR